MEDNQMNGFERLADWMSETNERLRKLEMNVNALIEHIRREQDMK